MPMLTGTAISSARIEVDQRSVDRDQRAELAADRIPLAAGDEAPAEGLEGQPPAPGHRRGDAAQQEQDEPGGAGSDQPEQPVSAGAAPRRRCDGEGVHLMPAPM